MALSWTWGNTMLTIIIQWSWERSMVERICRENDGISPKHSNNAERDVIQIPQRFHTWGKTDVRPPSLE